ncbi:MAG TPA: radical SAM protein [Desulfomonilaceae bacterium]|nr:radical SAM protein [Desulfomonilaceae bacterium]
MFEPAYLKTVKEEKIQSKIDQAREILKECIICPRNCRVNRIEGEKGFCQVGARAVVSSANPHFGEESPLVGSGGSGTIFMTSCNLQCLFCQNYEISHLMEGQEMDTATLGGLMVGLQRLGCHNINFVTPSHVVPQILDAVKWAAESGLRVPLVYNSGGYDSVETLRLLDGVIDIYMPDLKFMDSQISQELMNAADYPDVARAAIIEMHRQVGDLQINEKGIATRGLLVRHLVMPDDMAGTREAMRFLAKEVSTNTYVNIMNQYRPCGRAYEHSKLDRSVSRVEYTRAIEAAREEGIERLDDRVSLRLRFF